MMDEGIYTKKENYGTQFKLRLFTHEFDLQLNICDLKTSCKNPLISGDKLHMFQIQIRLFVIIFLINSNSIVKHTSGGFKFTYTVTNCV